MATFPQSGNTKVRTNSVRNRVRGPIHKLISYAELISEESATHIDQSILHAIEALLKSCEETLSLTLTIFEGNADLDDPELESIAGQLKPHFLQIESIARELKRLSESEESQTLQRDIENIFQAAEGFGSVLEQLHVGISSEKESRNSRIALSPQLAPRSAPQPLIAPAQYKGLLLVVDDDEGNRDVLSRRLLRDGYEVMLAEGGKQALRMLNRYNFDLVLLDIMMPDMDGISVLAELKKSPNLNQLPVIMITAVDEIETIAHCIESGADDYLLKPFNPVLLRARINALLDRKRLQDEQQRQRKELEKILEESRKEKARAEDLLLNILPSVVAEELKEFGSVKPMYFEDVSIVFADIVGFTHSTEHLPADELVEILNEYFTACDRIVARYGLEKLKTIGDCYMYAGGIPTRNPSHPVDCVLSAFEMVGAMTDLREQGKVDWQLRIGINTGPVIAGVVGIHKFAFDIWGDAVNFTSRVESSGAPGRVNLSASTFTRVKDFFSCEKREHVRTKDGKDVEMFFANGVSQGLLGKEGMTPLAAFQARYGTYFRKELHTFPLSMFG